jgi:hypothetical protein
MEAKELPLNKIMLICRVTQCWKNYEDPCDCGRFEEKKRDEQI